MKITLPKVLMGACALFIAGMAFLVPTSVQADVVATGSWEVHQDAFPDSATDLHFTIYQSEHCIYIKDYEITVEIVQPCPLGSDYDTATFVEHDDGHEDGRTHGIDCVFFDGSVPYCCKVRITAKLTLNYNNTVRIRDIVWTKDIPHVPDDLPDNGFKACKRRDEDLKFTFYNDDDSSGLTVSDINFYRFGTGYLDPDSLWGFGSWDFSFPGGSVAAGGSLVVSIPGFEFGMWLYFQMTITPDGGGVEVDFRGEHESKGPTYVELTSFEAIGHDGFVDVDWKTAAEVDNVGFNIHRGLTEEGPSAKLNDQLIEAQGSAIEGATYSFTDLDVTNGVTYYYWLEDVDIHGRTAMHGPVSATPEPTSVDEEHAPLPTSFDLAQNYPNPFNANTDIRYSLPRECDVRLSIYNLAGQRVRTLVADRQAAGHKVVSWNGLSDAGQEVSSGLYLYRLEAGDYTEVREMVFLK